MVFSNVKAKKNCKVNADRIGRVPKLYPTGITIVIGSTLNKGQLLLFSNLDGTFTYNSIKVDGNLTWIESNAVVNISEEFMWKFIDSTPFFIKICYIAKFVILLVNLECR